MVSGARCVATLLHEMKRRGKYCRFGVISMCIGTASLFLSLSLRTHRRENACLSAGICDLLRLFMTEMQAPEWGQQLFLKEGMLLTRSALPVK